jgi:hypothetical protein
LLVLAGDRWGKQLPGQIVVMSARKPGRYAGKPESPSRDLDPALSPA